MVEGTFKHLLHLLATISRYSRGKGNDGLDVFNAVEEINKNLQLDFYIPYNSNFRNGIAHGDYTYFNHKVEYRDKRDNIVKLSLREVVREFDNTLDICNAIMLSLKKVILSNSGSTVKIKSVYEEEIYETINHEAWRIVNTYDSIVRSGEKQLNLYVENRYFDWGKVHVNAVVSALLVEYYLSPLDRIYLTIKSSSSSTVGFCAFNGKAIAALRNNQYQMGDNMEKIVEDGIVFFRSKYNLPKLIHKVGTFFAGISSHSVLRRLQARINQVIHIRLLKFHSKKYYSVIERASVVIHSKEPDIYVKSNIEVIVGTVLNKQRKETSILSLNYFKPTKFIRIYIYSFDTRRREMNINIRTGLIAIIHYNSSGVIKDFIPKGRVEVIGRYTVIWQKEVGNKK